MNLLTVKRKKKCLEIDIITLEAAADEKADNAEKSRDIKKLLIESNALRRVARAKKTEITEIDEQIAKLEKLLKQ
ncbi:hypothetical protein SNE40_005106 [Patella caerulea]|uniref:Uncharacterized protein n=1 Tax=Patella caerulea TaxID=87958 RepID=A0AAN8KDP0_PATCE